MAKIVGNIKPIRAHILVEEMNFGSQTTASGIYIPSDDGKSEGIKPRWCRVYAVGHEQQDVKEGDWLLVEHGRWTRGIEIEREDGTKITIRRVDNNGILCVTDEKPNDLEFGQYTTPEHGSTHRPEDFIRPSL